MPSQARVGDLSQAPVDVHGCPACPHPVVGPAAVGSTNVLTNGLPSVRAGDSGTHAVCCGSNTWEAKAGSESVLINGKPAHRVGDTVKHCGGMGQTINGSANVLVGGPSAGGGSPASAKASPAPAAATTTKPGQVILVELVEIVAQSSEGVVVGAGPGSTKLKTLTTRTDRAPDGYKQFINLDKDVEGAAKRHAEYGRYIEVKARVEVVGGSPSGQSVKFSYDLTEGKDRPAGLSGNEKEGFASAGGAATTTATTDGDGWTPVVKFYVSQYAGDIFKISADASGSKQQLGAYQVWRKFWYQKTRAFDHLVPEPTASIAAYEKLFADMIATTEVTFTEKDAPDRTFYPGWMLEDQTGDTKESVIGNHNKAEFYKKYKNEPDKPVKGHLIICQHQWDPEAESKLLSITINTNPSAELQVTLDGLSNSGVLQPALSGSLVTVGKWSAGGKSGALDDTNVLITKGRSDLASFQISLPKDAPDPATTPVSIRIKLAYGKYYAGESNVHQMLIKYAGLPTKFTQVVAHEFGHGFGQNPKPGTQPPPLVDHPKHYTGHGGVGSHCSTDATLVTHPTDAKKNIYTGGTCIMFHQVNPGGCKQVFCDTCEPYLKLRDMSKLV